MKKLIFLLAVNICFASNPLYSQERVNKPIPKIGTQISGQLTKATGWLLNPQGQWVSGPNRIPAYNKILNVDEFNSYQFREIKIQDSTYKILIKRHDKIVAKNGGAYYDFIFYVFSKSELSYFDNIQNDTINLIKVDVLFTGNTIMANNDTYVSEIQKEIARQIQAKNDTSETDKELIKEGTQIDYPVTLVFQIAPYKSKNIIQFLIYSYQELDSEDKTIEGVSNAMDVTEGIDGEKFFLKNELFKHCYFESDYPTFNSFIRLSKPETK